MLNQLHVQNFALIEDLKLNLQSGLNIITGETGAGKSILLGALGLISGKRAEQSIVRLGAKKCIIEGEFSLKNYGLEKFFESNDLDFEEPSIVRREVALSGKSRAFINDTPVTLTVLKELGAQIIDVHSQHANLLLAKPEFTFKLLDSYSGKQKEVTSFQNKYLILLEKEKLLLALKVKQEQEKLNLEFNQFQLNELLSNNLKEGEQEQLEKEFEVLNNAEEIKDSAALVVNNISYDRPSVQGLLQEAEIALDSLSGYDNDYQELKLRLSSSLIEIKDIADEVEQKVGSVSANSARVSEIDERLSILFSLQKKYNVASVEQLILKREELQDLVNLVEGGNEGLETLNNRIEADKVILLKEANVLSKARLVASKEIVNEVVKDLKLMGIEHAQIDFKLEKTELFKFGIDKVDILFSANKGNTLAKLDNTASGGELSRVMLSLKRIMGTKTALPTIVFDEIDTGVSGEVANQMGALMKEMGAGLQVITITHLPQIAAKGNAHFKVFKSHDKELTTSQIEHLVKSLRINELTQMLSGSKVTETARKNAIELLEQK